MQMNIMSIFFFIFHLHNVTSCRFGLIAQLVEPCTGIEEVTGSNPNRPEFFKALILQLLVLCV